jgi:hypothetical protein
MDAYFEAGTNSKILQSSKTNEFQAPRITTASIFWGSGAVVGTYRVTVAPSATNFYVDREVNIVKVSITTTEGENNNLDYAKKEKIIQDGDPRKIISAKPAPAMLGQLRVTSIEGPAVRGTTRGVRFIEVGFIQNETILKLHADYDGFAIPGSRFSNVEGNKVWLDTIAPFPANISPWVDSKNLIAQSFFYHGLDPAVGAVTNIDLAIKDTPEVLATDTMPLTVVENSVQVTKTPTRFEILLDFNAYLAVSTKELTFVADVVYTQRAKAFWYFDGRGNVSDFNGTGDLNDMRWSNLVAGVDGDRFFAEVTSGAVVPVTDGMISNVATNAPNIVWATKIK